MRLNEKSIDEALARLDFSEKALRARIEKSLFRLAFYRRYRSAALLHLLKVVATLVKDNGLPCFFSGGMAYDALRGKLTRLHGDIDLLFLARYRPAVLSAFKRRDFRLQEKSRYHTVAKTETGQVVDLFSWAETAAGTAESICEGMMIRVPSSFFLASQTVWLHGVCLTLPGNELLKSVRPFVESKEDRLLLSQLETVSRIKSEIRVEPVVRRISLTVHEFNIHEQ